MGIPFTKVKRGVGYDIGQVNGFFSYAKEAWNDQIKPLTEREVRYARFDVVRKGYSIYEVDEALEYLEKALAKRAKTQAVMTIGENGWTELLSSSIKEFYGILNAPKKKKFTRKKEVKTSPAAYKFKAVDKYLKVIYRQFFLGRKKLNAKAVKAKTFPQVSGGRGYCALQVDAFLDDVVEALNALEV
jgi:DivIVA domain-containing protein